MDTKYTSKRDVLVLLENTLKGTKERRFLNDVIRTSTIVEQKIFEVIVKRG